jgi:hypothetical protein
MPVMLFNWTLTSVKCEPLGSEALAAACAKRLSMVSVYFPPDLA